MDTFESLIVKANQNSNSTNAGSLLAEFVRLAEDDVRAFVPLSPEGKIPLVDIMGENYIRAYTSVRHAGDEELTPMKLKDLYVFAFVDKSINGLLFNKGEYTFLLVDWMVEGIAEHISVSPEMVMFLADMLDKDE